MKKIIFIQLIIVIIIILVCVGYNSIFNKYHSIIDNTNKSYTKEEKQVIIAYKKVYQAIVDKNLDVLNRMILDDTNFINIYGGVQSKRELLDELNSGVLNYYKIEIMDISIKIDDNIATVMGTTKVTANLYGTSGSWNVNLNEKFKKIEGKWYLDNDI